MATAQGLPLPRPHAEPIATVVELLGSDAARGLSEAEAHRRLQIHGANSISSRGGKPD